MSFEEVVTTHICKGLGCMLLEKKGTLLVMLGSGVY